ncbi:MAG: mechanosensitive ion channel [Deltaproteobacteria bacterium]|nr:mechanosensitive ion channel [Deltaproteobacteria bacterium]
MNTKSLLLPLLIMAASLLAGLAAHGLLFRILDRIVQQTASAALPTLIRRGRNALRLLLPVFALMFAFPAVPLPEAAGNPIKHGLGLAAIAGIAWLLEAMTWVLEDLLLNRYDVKAQDNLAARKMQTQTRVLKRVLISIIWIIAGSAMLMTFDTVRQVGMNILASAGVAGIIIGFAAQRSLGTLFAGLQIAITQPIRLDDVVIVENEWGWIEELTLTYVVVRIWDQRRLVLPITYFTEKPFQNWTRTSAEILGTVYLYVDYTIPVQDIRQKLQELLNGSALWDGRICSVQVTGASEQTMEVRALMSAADSSKAWDLRCEVREQLIAFIQNRYPDSLPRTRAEVKAPLRG